MWEEFKKFALKGNMVDLAIGVVIGGAFGKIVTSLVNDLIMPPIGFLTGGVDFSKLSVSLGSTNPVEIKYGDFINNVVDFFIVAFSIFLAIKLMNKLRRKKDEQQPAPTPEEVLLLREIRDSLKNKRTN